MTEAEWKCCTDPTGMLEFLLGRVSDRKLRLYLCGGCRHLTHLFFRPESLAAVEVAERFADGQATLEELHRAEWSAEEPTFGYEFDKGAFSEDDPYKTSVVPRLIEMGVLSYSALSRGDWQVEETVRRRLIAAASLAEYCAERSPIKNDWGLRHFSEVCWPGRWLFDCVFGNPFTPVTINSHWLTKNDSTVARMAQAIYEERTFDHLPILADALEDAGCDNADFLAHCRQPGEHARGCWVVDLILGKQ
jgi:hypothetical protein